MKTYRCGRMENILGDEWYTIQKRTFMGIWLTYANFEREAKWNVSSVGWKIWGTS